MENDKWISCCATAGLPSVLGFLYHITDPKYSGRHDLRAQPASNTGNASDDRVNAIG
jgi:hypothetical protein